jgi:4-amino-4-deoxy-L-arabinose transferase-like glycosyltransferase
VARFARLPSHAFLLALAVCLALLHAVLAVNASAGKSTTADEIGHITAGLAYNSRADFRLQPENGNLTQRWIALPLALAHQPLPPADHPAWKKGDVWRYGHAFFYEDGLSTDEFLFRSRAMIALVSAATGLLIFLWSRALFGWRGAFLSLALFAFCPAFLANGALATSDVMMTFFFLAAIGAWWRHLENPGIANAALSACVFGLAFVAKFSAVLLAPMFALTAAAWLASRVRRDGWRRPLLRLGRTSVVHAAAAWAIIWLFYGFRFNAFAPAFADQANFNHDWTWIFEGLGNRAEIFERLKAWHVLPEAWLYGFAFVVQFAQERAAFLNGDHSTTGWIGFFPYAFLVKTTLPLLCLLTIGFATAARRTIAIGGAAAIARLLPLAPLAALFAVYWITSLTSHLNIGHRHILPTYPVLFIAAGWLGRWLDFRRPALAAVVAGLTLWHIGGAVRAWPNYLAYFNALAGGSENGWRHLVDSSLDWGQDLPTLKTWLARNAPKEKVFLAYFGTGDPAYEGISAERLPSLPEFTHWGNSHPKLTAGIYAVSATMLQQTYAPRDLCGPWTLKLELEYQKLHATEPALLSYQNDPAARPALLHEVSAQAWEAAWKRYDLLRFARLCHYLRVRKSDANAGYSILIYRLTPEEIAAATGSPDEWRAIMERAASSPR